MKSIIGNSRIGNSMGRLGENIAATYIKARNFNIIERNYRQKWGEIDIIAKKGSDLHFIEVKAVSREITSDVTRETIRDSYRAEDNIHPWKLKRLSRTIQSYLASQNSLHDNNWHFDAITVIIDVSSKKAYVKMISDLIL